MEENIELESDFTKVLKKADEIQTECEDYIVAASDITMDNDLNLCFANKKMPMSTVTTSGFCGKLKIPVTYFNRCAESNKVLAAQNVNNWLHNDNRQFMIRGYKNYARGCLSSSYSKFDAPEILKTFDEALDVSQYKLKGAFINEERMHIRLVEKEMLPIEGEDLFAGITLDSSDIGRSGLYVRFFIWKQICTNGLIIPKSSGELFRQKHIGITSEEFGNGLIEGFKKFNSIKTRMIDVINETKQIPTNDDIAEEIKHLTSFTDEDIEEIMVLADTRYDRSRWGVINGMTQVAQKYTLEKRLALEQIAGEMLLQNAF